MAWTFDDLLTVTFSLFAVIDIVGSVPLLISIKERLGGINGIAINLVIVYLTLRSLKYIARLLGASGLTAVRKFFGVVLLAIAVKIFTSNVGHLIK